MTNIVMYTGKTDKALICAVSRVLTRIPGTLISCRGRLISRFGDIKRKLCIIRDGERPPESDILILGDSPEDFSPSLFPESPVYIVNSRNLRALSSVSGKRAIVVGCSCSNRDTLCISGTMNGSVALSLDRSLVFDGKMIPPQEIILRGAQNYPPYALLAAGAVALLTGSTGDGRISLA